MSPEPGSRPPIEVSVADWTAGYEAGWTAGYRAAMTVLDEAGAFLATTLQPSHALDVIQARRATGGGDGGRESVQRESDHRDPTQVAAARVRVYASWGLTPPDTPQETP
jgi:hypothetical protein